MRTGRSYLEWRTMPRWARLDYMHRYQAEVKERAKLAQKGFAGLVGAVVSKILGA